MLLPLAIRAGRSFCTSHQIKCKSIAHDIFQQTKRPHNCNKFVLSIRGLCLDKRPIAGNERYNLQRVNHLEQKGQIRLFRPMKLHNSLRYQSSPRHCSSIRLKGRHCGFVGSHTGHASLSWSTTQQPFISTQH